MFSFRGSEPRQRGRGKAVPGGEVRVQDPAAVGQQVRRERRLERLLKWGLVMLLLGVLAVSTAMIYSFITVRNAPPKTYFDYQLRLWQSAISEDPTNAAAYEQLGYIYLKMERYGQAINTFNTGLKHNSKQVGILYNLGVAYWETDKEKEAIDNLNKAASFASAGDKYLAYFKLGEIYEELNKPTAAIDNYKKSLQDNATIWNTHFSLGKLYEKEGRGKLALASYQQAGLFNPTHEGITQAIARLSGK